MAKKVIVGLSGGVDSSVSALLLKQQGYDVEAVFMKNWEEDDNNGMCSAEEDIADAQSVCTKLGIPLHSINFSEDYLNKVFSYFLSEYSKGRTPNPDILCNKEIKFKAFLEYALSIGADYIATGHYAQKTEEGGEFFLKQGLDKNKDQTYFLYTLQQHQLAKVLFPVGGIEKTKVREIAKEYNLITHNKKDSTGICFIGERKFKQFLANYLPAKPGNIITAEGKSIGKHDGLMYYTLGQRQGLNIGGVKGSNEKPWYVADKDLNKNNLIVVQGDDHPLLYKQNLIASDLSWVSTQMKEKSFSCEAKIRYRQAQESCTVELQDNNTAVVKFPKSQKAITPGQAIVFYQNELCLGGGTIN